MLERNELFPNVIELNYQAKRRLSCCVYLVFDGTEWLLIDIGYADVVEVIIEMIRQLDFPLASCRYLVATHADVDHVQGLAQLSEILPQAKTCGHPDTARLLAQGDRVTTYAEIAAQGISIEMPVLDISLTIDEGDRLKIGQRELEVWHTPGHTVGQLAFRMGNLLFSGDNIFRDGCVGNIDAHHGSDLPAFIQSLQRILESDVEWLLPSHGPVFRKDDALLQATIQRLEQYCHMSDFGTCATDWPLLAEWEQELAQGFRQD